MGNKSVVQKKRREQNKSGNEDILLGRLQSMRNEWMLSGGMDTSSGRMAWDGPSFGAEMEIPPFLRWKITPVKTCKQKIPSVIFMGILCTTSETHSIPQCCTKLIQLFI